MHFQWVFRISLTSYLLCLISSYLAGLLTTCLLQAAYWNAFQEASLPYTRSSISTAPFACSLLSSLLWTAYALPIVTPRRVLFLLAHLLQSLSLSALLLALISSDPSGITLLRLRQVLQLLLPASGLSILVLFLGSFFAPSSLVIGWTASAAAALLLAFQPLSRMISLLDTASCAQPSHLFVSCSALAAACTWAAFGFAAHDHFISVPYVVVAVLEALFFALSTFLGKSSVSRAIPLHSFAPIRFVSPPFPIPLYFPSHPQPPSFPTHPLPLLLPNHPHPLFIPNHPSLPISTHPYPPPSTASSAASQQRAAEGYELVAPTASESGLTEQSL
ncbi:unnamed protein product [Closterium sp. Naga37s-1]|nr:unnamed protein product [Closterium sp. Naga37s-1]